MNEQEVKLELAQCKDLQERIDEFCELCFEFFDNFDGSEYQQGKKDGMRLALSFVTGDLSWKNLNRGGSMARTSYEKTKMISKKWGTEIEYGNAPEWAKWSAVDENGEFWWFEEKPYIDKELKCWVTDNGQELSPNFWDDNEEYPEWRGSLAEVGND